MLWKIGKIGYPTGPGWETFGIRVPSHLWDFGCELRSLRGVLCAPGDRTDREGSLSLRDDDDISCGWFYTILRF